MMCAQLLCCDFKQVCMHEYIMHLCHLYSMIVTGDAAGCVKFFDKELKLLNW